MPRLFFPYMFFSTMTPNASQTFDSVSASSRNGMPYFFLNFWCDATESRLTPTIVAPFFSNFLTASRNCVASLVQPGVSSFG